MNKKPISFVLLFLIAFNFIGASFAVADIPQPSSEKRISYAFSNTDGVTALSDSQMDNIEGEWGFFVNIVIRYVIVPTLLNYCTSVGSNNLAKDPGEFTTK